MELVCRLGLAVHSGDGSDIIIMWTVNTAWQVPQAAAYSKGDATRAAWDDGDGSTGKWQNGQFIRLGYASLPQVEWGDWGRDLYFFIGLPVSYPLG